ncbi:hypothetical protein A2U01_0071090, partial [Trifolium medium]|nr:hypothetical protein [Trifolium medium]
CDDCVKHVKGDVTPRYRVKFRVFDGTEEIALVLFDRDVTSLVNRTCVDMIRMVNTI